MMSWDGYMNAWGTHAQTDAYCRRLDRSIQSALNGAQQGNLFCALSGGKDGVALAAVVHAAGLRDTMLAHMHTPLNTPGMLECSEKTAERLDMDLDIAEPERDVWQWLGSWPCEYSLRDRQHYNELCKLCASGNMLVAYQYANGYRGSFTGMRAEESRGRRMNRIMRGTLYQLAKDASWICQPIVDWSARDVFACAVANELPIHPYYQQALERLHIDPESPASRVDCMITSEDVTSLDVLTAARVLYPELYRRIIALRPELRSQ